MMNLREKGKRDNNDSRLSDDESVGSEKKKARIDEQGDRDADAAADDDNDDPKEPQQVETNLKFSISFGARRVDKAVSTRNSLSAQVKVCWNDYRLRSHAYVGLRSH